MGSPSTRERGLWLAAGAVLVAIAASLAITPDVATQIRRSSVSAPFFAGGMVVIAALAVWQGWSRRPSAATAVVGAGVAVALLGVARVLSAAERSHLIEYAALALLVHAALHERYADRALRRPAVVAAAATSGVGVLDELVQLAIPHRVFDPVDIVFNVGAAVGAIATVELLRRWTRR